MTETIEPKNDNVLNPDNPMSAGSPNPQYSRFQEVMGKIFETSEGGIHSGKPDGDPLSKEQEEKLLAKFTEEISNRPQGLISEIDTILRGRYVTDSPRLRVAKIMTHVLVGSVATAIDLTDAFKDTVEMNPVGYALANGIEYITDSIISVGGDWIVQKSTGKDNAYYSTPLSETISTILNLIPFTKSFVNGTNIEAAFRMAYNLPVSGALVERLYILGNKSIDSMNKNAKAKWIQGLVMVMSRGYTGKQYKPPSGARPGIAIQRLSKKK